MVRCTAVAAVALFSLSCASSGRLIRYELNCPMGGCTVSVSYRNAWEMKQGVGVNNWNHQFVSASGGQFELTVRRTDMTRRGYLYIHVYIDDREVMSDSLKPGETGPITLAGEIPTTEPDDALVK